MNTQVKKPTSKGRTSVTTPKRRSDMQGTQHAAGV